MTTSALVSFSPPCHHQGSAASTFLHVVLSPLPHSHLKPPHPSSLPWTVTVLLISCFLSLTSEHGIPTEHVTCPHGRRQSQILLMLIRLFLIDPSRPLGLLRLPRSLSPEYSDLPTAPHTSYHLTGLPELLPVLGDLRAAAPSRWKIPCPVAHKQPQLTPTHIIHLPAQLPHSVFVWVLPKAEPEASA